MFASTLLHGDVEQVWSAQEDGIYREDYSWEDFCHFLINQVEDPVNRGFMAALQFVAAMQQPGQTVQAFTMYFKECYDKLATDKET